MLIFSDPSALVCTVLYLALVMLVGYCLQAAIAGPGVRHWLELLGVCFALGGGAISFMLFFASLAGIKPGRPVLVVIAIIALPWLFALWKVNRLIRPSVPAPRGKFDMLSVLGIGGLLLIAAAFCNMASRGGWPGLNDIDAFAIWMLKAKVVTLQPLCPIPWAFTLPTLSYSHQDYPLSLPFLVAGLYAALGHINDEQAKILLLPIYLSVIAILYAGIRRMHRRAVALAITAIFVGAPTLTQNAGLLVAETPLILAWTGALVMLLRWIETRQRSDLLLCGLFSVIAAFTKNEGLALMSVLGLVTLVIALMDRPVRRDWLTAAILCTAIITPWLIYRTFLPKTHEDYGGKLTHTGALLNNLNRLNYILPQFFGRLFDGPEVGSIWCVLFLTALFGYRGFIRRPVVVLWIILIVQLGLYTATFVVTPWPVRTLLPMIGPKLLTQASPVAALLLGLHWREIRA